MKKQVEQKANTGMRLAALSVLPQKSQSGLSDHTWDEILGDPALASVIWAVLENNKEFLGIEGDEYPIKNGLVEARNLSAFPTLIEGTTPAEREAIAAQIKHKLSTAKHRDATLIITEEDIARHAICEKMKAGVTLFDSMSSAGAAAASSGAGGAGGSAPPRGRFGAAAALDPAVHRPIALRAAALPAPSASAAPPPASAAPPAPSVAGIKRDEPNINGENAAAVQPPSAKHRRQFIPPRQESPGTGNAAPRGGGYRKLTRKVHRKSNRKVHRKSHRKVHRKAHHKNNRTTRRH